MKSIKYDFKLLCSNLHFKYGQLILKNMNNFLLSPTIEVNEWEIKIAWTEEPEAHKWTPSMSHISKP